MTMMVTVVIAATAGATPSVTTKFHGSRQIQIAASPDFAHMETGDALQRGTDEW